MSVQEGLEEKKEESEWPMEVSEGNESVVGNKKKEGAAVTRPFRNRSKKGGRRRMRWCEKSDSDGREERNATIPTGTEKERKVAARRKITNERFRGGGPKTARVQGRLPLRHPGRHLS